MSFDDEERKVSGARPVELYVFSQGATRWLWTSADEDLEVPGLGFFTRETISSGQVEHSRENASGSLEVYVEEDNPVAVILKSGAGSAPMRLTVYLAHRDHLDDYTAWWAGRMIACDLAEGQATLSGISVVQLLQSKAAGFVVQAQCPHVLYSPPCGADQAANTDSAVVSAVSGRVVESATFALRADGWYRAGKLYPPGGAPVFIVDHVGAQITLIDAPSDVSVGDTVLATRGCDRLMETCFAFSNLINFTGFPWMPKTNPFTQGVR